MRVDSLTDKASGKLGFKFREEKWRARSEVSVGCRDCEGKKRRKKKERSVGGVLHDGAAVPAGVSGSFDIPC